MNGRQRNATNLQILERKMTRIMMATVLHITSGSGLRKFQADRFLFDRVYNPSPPCLQHTHGQLYPPFYHPSVPGDKITTCQHSVCW